MPRTYVCPFFMWERGKTLRCERCRMDFPDEAAKKEYADKYCAETQGWRACTVARALLRWYERTDTAPG